MTFSFVIINYDPYNNLKYQPGNKYFFHFSALAKIVIFDESVPRRSRHRLIITPEVEVQSVHIRKLGVARLKRRYFIYHHLVLIGQQRLVIHMNTFHLGVVWAEVVGRGQRIGNFAAVIQQLHDYVAAIAVQAPSHIMKELAAYTNIVLIGETTPKIQKHTA